MVGFVKTLLIKLNERSPHVEGAFKLALITSDIRSFKRH